MAETSAGVNGTTSLELDVARQLYFLRGVFLGPVPINTEAEEDEEDFQLLACNDLSDAARCAKQVQLLRFQFLEAVDMLRFAKLSELI